MQKDVSPALEAASAARGDARAAAQSWPRPLQLLSQMPHHHDARCAEIVGVLGEHPEAPVGRHRRTEVAAVQELGDGGRPEDLAQVLTIGLRPAALGDHLMRPSGSHSDHQRRESRRT